MPRHYKAQLKHVGFDWPEWTEIFCRDLCKEREAICKILGFYTEHGSIGELGGRFDQNITIERDRLIAEIAGILSKAAAIAIDGGFAPNSQSIATLEAIRKKPGLVREQLTEIDPGALEKLAKQYQRSSEIPGTYSLDVLAAMSSPAW
jgi:hypothetical protein